MFGIFDTFFSDFLGPNTFGPCGTDDINDPKNYEGTWTDDDWQDYYGDDPDWEDAYENDDYGD